MITDKIYQFRSNMFVACCKMIPMKKIVFLYLFLLTAYTPISAQTTYTMQPGFLQANKVWIFGYKAGVDFNSGSPVPIESSHTGIEGGTSVSDPVTGRLLFYSNGMTCWNTDNQPMPNGSNLQGNGTGSCSNPCLSTRQGVCIVPLVGAPGKYYLFSLTGPTNAPATYANGSLFYSVVDMTLGNGKGDIVPGSKNIVLSSDTLSECMIAIPGNKCDIWLLLHNMNSHQFKAYHITAAGIDPNPVISTVVSSITGNESFAISELSVSPDRSKIALTSQTMDNNVNKSARGILLAKFDPATGIVSNGFNLMHTNEYRDFYAGSTSFSPNSSLLYASAYSNLTGFKYVIYQFDVSLYDSATIAASVLKVDTFKRGTPVIFKLYNNKIYLTEFDQNKSPLHCINYPDARGKGYGLDTGIAYFLPGTYATLTLGNHVVRAPEMEGVASVNHDVSLCKGKSLTLQPSRNINGHYTWDDNSTNPSRIITAPGAYQVTYYESGCDVTRETFHVTEIRLDPVINVNGFVLSTSLPYKGYQWLLDGNKIPGATDSVYEVKKNGKYQVVVHDENGCTDTSKLYDVTNVSVSTLSADPDIRIYPNPARDLLYIKGGAGMQVELGAVDGRCLVHCAGTDPVSIAHLAAGIYLIRITDADGRIVKVEKIVKE